MHVRMSGEIQLFATLFDNLGHRAYSAHEMPTEADEIQQGETDERPLEGHGWNPLCLYQLSFSEVQAKGAVCDVKGNPIFVNTGETLVTMTIAFFLQMA